MHTNEPRELQGVELGYDPRDIEAKSVTRFFFWFFVFAIVAFGTGAVVYTRMGLGGRSNFDPRKPKIAGPLLQGNITTKTDIMSLRQYEKHLMTTYEPQPNGTWRIPVDRAITLLGSRGLPTIASAAPAKSTGTTIQQNAIGPATEGNAPTTSPTTEPSAPTTPPAETAPHSSPEGTAPAHSQP